LVFGSDGLLARYEQFDTDRPADALARFDELTAEPSAVRRATAPARSAEWHARRVRPNGATANAARTDAAIATRDADAIADLFADDADGLEHPTGATFDRRGSVFSLRSLLSARDPRCRHEPLATLGDALALFRTSISAGGYAGGKLHGGAYEREEVTLIEVHGRRRRHCPYP